MDHIGDSYFLGFNSVSIIRNVCYNRIRGVKKEKKPKSNPFSGFYYVYK